MKSFIKLAVIFVLAFGTFYVSIPDASAATLRNAAMVSAHGQRGAKYTYGAEGGYIKGYDCSGLVWWAYKKNGKTLPRTAQAQYDKSKHISAASRAIGDLVFIKDRSGHVYHVGIFTGIFGGKAVMTNANTGSYRGYRVVINAPISEYTTGGSTAVYGRY